MLTIIQRVSEARVMVQDQMIGAIGPGLLALVAIAVDDDDRDIDWTAAKLVSLRIFRNEDKHFDLNVREIGGSILLVSNFTVAAEIRKGRRPSLDGAASPGIAEGMFQKLVDAARATGVPVETGRFAADMNVQLVNDGPATFILNSRLMLQRQVVPFL